MAWGTIIEDIAILRNISWLIGKSQVGRLFFSKPAITNLRNNDVVQTPITVRGTHRNQMGNYWLVTDRGNWPKQKVDFGRRDGRWEEEIHMGANRQVTISLVKVSNLLHTMFEKWQQNAKAAQNWDIPFPLSTDAKRYVVEVDSITVKVAPSRS